MSSNGEKRMMKRSEFAQKLLNDLRVRKEQLSVSQNTDKFSYSNRGFKGSKETRAKSTTFQDFNYCGIEESNEIVPYGKGRSVEKIDLSKALAFALENAGKATRADPSGNASIISFLHEVGNRCLGYGTAERRRSQQQLPMVHVHIKEISKGAHKLNQIIKACSNGLSFRKGRYCGEQLMEGAVELEQSLRLLVDIQQASSQYITKKQRKNRIKLLEENDDVPNRKIKEVAKADIEMRLLALNYPEDKNNKHTRETSSCEDTDQKPQKGRIPNVVAKLMGLGEFPEDEKEIKNKNDASIKSAENLTRPQAVETKAQRNSTQKTGNEISYKAKSQEKDDSKNRKRNNVIRKNSSPTENKHKAVARTQQKPLRKLSFEKKLISRGEQEKLPHEIGAVTNYSQTKLPLTEKEKAEFHEKNHPNGGLCKVMKNQKLTKEADGKHDRLLLTSFSDSNKVTEEAAATCINNSQLSGVEVKSSNMNDVERKREFKDDSILLITAERVPSENHHELMFTDGVDQQAPISKSANSERFSKTVYKGSNGEVEAGIPLLEKRQEHQNQETKETLSENEMNIKKIVVKSQLFLDTSEALFKLNIPLNVLNEVGGNNSYQEDKNLLLDCGYEIMKRKGRYQELSVHPFVKVPIISSKVNSLDHLVRQISKEFEKLRTYGRDCNTESLVEDYLPKVLERDVHHKDPNLSSMWDMGWNDLMLAFIEKDDVIRDIEREVFNALLEEITRDLICI